MNLCILGGFGAESRHSTAASLWAGARRVAGLSTLLALGIAPDWCVAQVRGPLRTSPNVVAPQQIQQNRPVPAQGVPGATQDPLARYNGILDQPDQLSRIPQNDLVALAIRETSRRTLVADRHTPWQVVHGVLALRWDLRLREQPTGKLISGIEWIMGGAFYDNQPLWQETPYGGQGHPFTRPYAFEGHPTQFLGYMCLANIPLDYEVATPTKVITVRDIVQDAKMQVRTGREITWTLWALAHYESPDAQWTNATGEAWSIERLLKMQVDEPVTSGACGGCHGLFALAYARNLKLDTGESLRGVWVEADQKVKRYIEEARSLQNADGSFSSNHLLGPGETREFGKRISTSGHQLEWLMMSLPQDRLSEEWIQRGITSVARDLVVNRNTEADCGPLFHALHALVLYRQRTVPGYEQPKINSALKLAERQHKGKGVPSAEPARTTQTGRRSGDQIRRLSGEQEEQSVLTNQRSEIGSEPSQDSIPE